MDKKTLAKIYEFLEWDVLEKLEHPCEECGYFECQKNTLNAEDIIKKKYKWNDIDYKHCLKRNKQRLKELMEILRHPKFKQWSNKKCMICGEKFFKHDMQTHLEIEKKPEKHYYKLESIRLCKKCNPIYKRRKKPLNKEYEKI